MMEAMKGPFIIMRDCFREGLLSKLEFRHPPDTTYRDAHTKCKHKNRRKSRHYSSLITFDSKFHDPYFAPSNRLLITYTLHTISRKWPSPTLTVHIIHTQ